MSVTLTTVPSINNYTFNWSRMLSFEGDTGPYIQYAHVRLASMERKNPNLVLPAASEIRYDLLSEPKAREIVFHLSSYPDVVRIAGEKHEPSGVVTFCMKLAHMIASAWETLLVKGEADEDKTLAGSKFSTRRKVGSFRKATAGKDVEMGKIPERGRSISSGSILVCSVFFRIWRQP